MVGATTSPCTSRNSHRVNSHRGSPRILAAAVSIQPRRLRSRQPATSPSPAPPRLQNFPLVRSFRSMVSSRDAAVLVLDRSGTFLEFSTYWGGRNNEGGAGVAVDPSGNVYVTGDTSSSDLPVSTAAFDSRCGASGTCDGSIDAFVVKIDPTGSPLASTYLGSTGLDLGRSIAVRPNGQVLVLGTTQSADFALIGAQPFQRWRVGANFEQYVSCRSRRATRADCQGAIRR